MSLWTVIDLLLVLMLLVLGSTSLLAAQLQRAVVFFIAFGLVLSLIWARLRAPDLAIAEAAIGAGLTGALMLSALGDRASNAQTEPAPKRCNRWAVNGLSLTLFILLSLVWLETQEQVSPAYDLAASISQALPQSGVTNPVTAVLLNFRAYDTLLELAVLLAAALGILSLRVERAPFVPAGVLLRGTVGLLTPLLIFLAGYLLWIGASAPGGAFQAGAVLAAVMIVLRLAGHRQAGLPGIGWQKLLLVAGVALFSLIGLGMLLLGQSVLQYPAHWAGSLILAIETVAMLSIAVTLTLAYIGLLPGQSPQEPRP